MTDTPEAIKLFELYDLMEQKLEELGLEFDEFTILYKSFRGPSVKIEEPKVNTNPFPWLKGVGSPGQGYS